MKAKYICHAGMAGLFLALSLILPGCGGNRGVEPAAAEEVGGPLPFIGEMPEGKEAPVAFVNQVLLTRGELEEQLDELLLQAQLIVPESQREVIRNRLSREIIRNFIIKQLVRQEAERHQITISDRERAYFLGKLRENLPDGMGVEEYFARTGPAGRDRLEEFENNMRMEMLMRRELGDKSLVTSDDIEKFGARQAEQRRLQRFRAEDLRQRLEEGEDFAGLALEYSSCRSRARKGILGPVTADRLPDQLAREVFSLPVGELSEIIGSDQGYHLVSVLERGGQAVAAEDDTEEESEPTVTFHHIELPAPLHSRKTQIEIIRRQKHDQLSRQYLRSLLERAEVGAVFPDIVL